MQAIPFIRLHGGLDPHEETSIADVFTIVSINGPHYQHDEVYKRNDAEYTTDGDGVP